jgi:hypothetical protein
LSASFFFLSSGLLFVWLLYIIASSARFCFVSSCRLRASFFVSLATSHLAYAENTRYHFFFGGLPTAHHQQAPGPPFIRPSPEPCPRLRARVSWRRGSLTAPDLCLSSRFAARLRVAWRARLTLFSSSAGQPFLRAKFLLFYLVFSSVFMLRRIRCVSPFLFFFFFLSLDLAYAFFCVSTLLFGMPPLPNESRTNSCASQPSSLRGVTQAPLLVYSGIAQVLACSTAWMPPCCCGPSPREPPPLAARRCRACFCPH